jgi:hypothetical protein
MFIQLPSALDGLSEPTPAEPALPDDPGTLTIEPAPRARRWADGAAHLLHTSGRGARRWQVRVLPQAQDALTWTAPPAA